jgi:EAL domain-containing protein (putative c-di-GMP-specific phosphodiesterase class I)
MNEVKTRVEAAKAEYQPKIDASTLELAGFEALVRLRDNNLSPAVFIPVAEKNGYINTIGRIITEKTVQQLARWRDEGLPIRPVSINYSSYQINDTEYIDYLKSLLETYHLSSEYIEIEITESLIFDDSNNSK